MKHELLKLVYIRKRERKSLLLVASVLLLSSFSDDIYLAISAPENEQPFTTSVESDTILAQVNIEPIASNSVQKKPAVKAPSQPIRTEARNSLSISRSQEAQVVTEASATKPLKELPIKVSTELKFITVDPNNPRIDDLVSIGIPKNLAKTWSKYTSAGGKIQDREDLLKIYGMQENYADKLEKHIKYPKKISYAKYKKVTSIYINQASAFEFSKISGIGPVLSERIIKFRNRLGGFHSAQQLTEVYGVEEEIVAKNSDIFLIELPVKKLNINTCNEQQLGAHSYCSYRMAKAIINYRNQHGNFTSSADFEKLRVVDKKWIASISPYLEY